jgi:hypothetical protein
MAIHTEENRYISIEPKHRVYTNNKQPEKINISNIEEGKYFIGVGANGYYGYRRLTINRKTAKKVQKFIFHENDYESYDRLVFLEK